VELFAFKEDKMGRGPGHVHVEYGMQILKRTIDNLRQTAMFYKFDPDDCPIATRQFLERDHRRYSKILTGIGYTTWECPFCKTEFSD
jgi:hypothetical protein